MISGLNPDNSSKDVHNAERAIVFRFGIYFEGLIRKDKNFKRINLDCEYNRNLYDVKRDNEGVAVIPDLILHERNNHENNILVMEFKTWWNKDTEIDEIKLKNFTCKNGKYKYKLGVSVLLGKTREKIEIILFQDGQKLRNDIN